MCQGKKERRGLGSGMQDGRRTCWAKGNSVTTLEAHQSVCVAETASVTAENGLCLEVQEVRLVLDLFGHFECCQGFGLFPKNSGGV